MKAKERRTLQLMQKLDTEGRNYQTLQNFNRMKSRDLSQAVEMALDLRIENEDLLFSLKSHHLSKQGDMPMRVLHALLMKQPDDFDYYDSLRTPIMVKLSRDPTMLEDYLQYAQNATPNWEDTTFKRVEKTAPNGQDIYGFIGVVSYDGTRKVTPHIVFDKDEDIAYEKAMQTLVHNIMDKNLRDTTPANDEDGYDMVRVHRDGKVSYNEHRSVKYAAEALNAIIDEFGLAVSNNKFRTGKGNGNVTYTFEIAAEEFTGDPEALRETFTRTSSTRPSARRAAAVAALDSRMLFEVTGYTLLPQTSRTRAKICTPAA